MKTTVVHSCTHARELEAAGPRKAAQLRKWMATVKCPSCRAREELLAQPRLGPFTTEQLAALVGLK